MFHVKPSQPKTARIYIANASMGHQPVFGKICAEIKGKQRPLESLDNTGVSGAKRIKKRFLRSFSMKWKLCGTLLVLSSISFGQLEPVAIGEWKIHMPLRQAKDVAMANDKYYTAFQNGIYVYDGIEGSHELISKTNGLTSIGISQIEYFPMNQTIVVGYVDGNIDLISSEGEIYNMSDIKRSNIVGDKSILNLVVINDFVYVCTGFGIVVLDPVRKEIKDTYILGNGGTYLKVYSVCSDGVKLFAATEEGLYSGLLTDPFLSNYASWTKDTTLNSSAVNGPFDHIAFHANKLFVSREITGYNNDTLYVWDGSWSSFSSGQPNDVNKMKSIGPRLLIIGNGTIDMLDQTLTSVAGMTAYTFDYIDAADADYNFSENQFYVADKRYGLVRGVNTWGNEKLTINSPYNTGAVHVDVNDGVVLVSHDGFAGVNGINYFSTAIMSTVYEDDWRVYNSTTQPLMSTDSIFDGVAVLVDPSDKNHWFLGTYSYKGVFEFQDGEIINVYDETNSTLTNAGIVGYNSVSSMDLDQDGNLWVINSKSFSPLVVKDPNGEWYSTNLGASMNNRNIYEVEAAKSGYVWIAAPTGNSIGGLLVLNPNGTLSTTNDDEYFIYSSGVGTGNLPSQDVKCVTEDLDGEIWIGTANGIGVIYDQPSIFDGNRPDAQQILIEQDGNVQILFENEVITDIEIDGANRKWFATEGSGVYLMSEDGQEQILHLTKENSPLLSNLVTDIAIDHISGDVYFATADGLLSLRYTATGSKDAYLDVYPFPNPVKQDYEGIIAVKGLSRDSDFKVTDVTGNLVYHGISTGGQAIWDLKDLKGNRVSSGVYLIYCNSENGSKDAVAKLLVIN